MIVRLPRGAISAVVLTMGSAGAACGGDDGGDALSESELVREANAVCQDADSDVEAVFAGLPRGSAPEPAAIQELIGELLPVVEGVSDDLDDLQPPAGLKGRYDEAIAKLREGNAKVREAGESPEAADCGSGETAPPPAGEAPGGTGG